MGISLGSKVSEVAGRVLRSRNPPKYKNCRNARAAWPRCAAFRRKVCHLVRIWRSYRHPTRLGDAHPGIALGASVVDHVANHAAQLSPRIHVVAHIRDPAFREVMRAYPQNGVPHRRGHPTINPVTDDIVEALAADSNAAMSPLDANVPKADSHAGLAVAHMALGQVDAAKLAAGKAHRQRNDVAARGAAEFEHAAL